MNEKKVAGERAAHLVQDGMVVGLGTGSTVHYTILELASMVKDGLSITGIPTSKQTELLAREHGIPLVTLGEVEKIDLTIDGADELDGQLTLIKGGGGALLREKMIAYHSKKMIVVADSNKLVRQLGAFPLPVEVVPFGYQKTMDALTRLGCRTKLRTNGEEIFITDNENMIVDCSFDSIPSPPKLHEWLNAIPGVVENGLFIGMAEQAFIGRDGGVTVIE
ncbi:ribose-5-phosphate isomerase RpiA [Alkalihalobacillus sp. CinArs1]|uniref:ribose-5-phosphate isomerase RpiA n=1 Tax=Alkalihalobacillus sp. CinArs1 TaxID=2995314 RepID=UPI0022DDB699|nr:ribose-5-phosphate isomerase RpiA [Alkalihalobacillus sp. CinArs1]